MLTLNSKWQKIDIENIKSENTKVTKTKTKVKIQEHNIDNSLLKKSQFITKAGLDHLPDNALFGALLSLGEQLNDNENIISSWIVHGNQAFNKEKQCNNVICKFTSHPAREVRDFIKSIGLNWNKLTKRWEGNVQDLDALKSKIKDTEHQLELIE